MPQLDFREALSSPEEKIFSVGLPVTTVSCPPLSTKSFLSEGGLSHSTWANIVFVAIAAIGGLVCAFYFFNGGELLRAAAAWPSEFLYPRPLSTEKIDVAIQPNAVDQYNRGSNSLGTTNSDTQNSSDQEFPNLHVAQAGPTTESAVPLPGTLPPPGGTILLPVSPVPPITPVVPVLPVPPLPPVVPPLPDSIFQDLNTVPSGPGTVAQLYQTLTDSVATMLPKNVPSAPARSSVSSARKKVASTRQKASGRATAATSTAYATQQLTAQLQSSGVQNQTMFGGGMGAVSGIGSVGSSSGVGSSGTGVGSVGTPGGVGGPGVGSISGIGGIGGLGAGLGGIGSGLGGVGSGIGVIGGHH